MEDWLTVMGRSKKDIEGCKSNPLILSILTLNYSVK